MDYILSGDPKEVAKVLQENRIRVDRGVIKFTPCQPETAATCEARTPREIPEELYDRYADAEAMQEIDLDEAGVTDDKYADDVPKEIDLDTDDKTDIPEDVKDIVIEEDVKEVRTSRKTRKS